VKYFTEKDDALSQLWSPLSGKNFWLNPPYSHIEPWAKKCAETVETWKGLNDGRTQRQRIFFLVPAGVGSNWFARHVHLRALVFFLNGRIRFVGQEQYYPKDNILCVFGAAPEYVVWRWRDSMKVGNRTSALLPEQSAFF
jgi:phage N-6-adenine-methyltransferase